MAKATKTATTTATAVVGSTTGGTSDLFRFVTVRGVNAPEKDAMNRRFIKCDLSPADPAFIAQSAAATAAGTPITPLLIFDLPKLKDNPKSEELMMEVVSNFHAGSINRISFQDLGKYCPAALYEVYLWHRNNNTNKNIKAADFSKAVKTALQMTPINFIKTAGYYLNKLRLWENLVAEYIIPTESSLVSRLVEIIRWYWIIENLAKVDAQNQQVRLLDGQEIYEAMNATVILPDDTLYMTSKINPENEPGNDQPGEEEERQRDIERLQQLQEAADEVNSTYKSQANDNNYEKMYSKERIKDAPANAGIAPSILSRRYLDTLSAKTFKVLDSFDVIRSTGVIIPQVLDKINLEKNRIIDKYQGAYHPSVVANINGQLIRIDNMCHHYNPADPCAPYKGPTLPKGIGIIRTPGVADLKVIKSVLLKYDRGEIAHIENILKGESKEREFNTLTRNEQTIFTEEDTTTETQKETQSTDRFELEKEISSLVKEDMKFDTGVKVSATLGPVNLDTHVDFALSNSKEESNKTATKNSQELVSRALSKIIETKKTQKTVTTIVQTEDNNKHVLDNKAGNNNIHGLYYWIDKYYLSKVVNYGKRLMFEFVVPEPAAFYIYSKVNPAESLNKDAKEKPEYPSIFSPALFIATGGKQSMLPIKSYLDINENNYAGLAAKYNAADVKPPDPLNTVLVDSVQVKGTGDTVIASDRDGTQTTYLEVSLAKKDIAIPSGYVADRAYVTIAGWGVDINLPIITILLGNIKRGNADFAYTQEFYPLNAEDTLVPFAVWGYNTGGFVLNIEINCTRTDKKLKEWQITTYNSILTAYNTKLNEYENWLKEQNINAGINIQGNNEGINRMVEKEELKKHCIELMSGQRFETFDAMRSNVPDLGYPEFSFNEANAEGNYIQFFEQAFEWEQMTYLFYPYFWGRKPNWIMIKSITDPDPIFTSFLQAGAARVLVPARPGFEKVVIHYFASKGQIWNGGDPPIPGDSFWVSIVDEIKEQQGQFESGTPEGDPWIYKMPTSLVYLDDVAAKLLNNTANYPNDVTTATKPKPDDFS